MIDNIMPDDGPLRSDSIQHVPEEKFLVKTFLRMGVGLHVG